MKSALIILIAAALCGCAYTTQHVSTQATGTNGVVEVRTIRSRTVAWGDSRQVVEKLKVSNGKTQSIGIAGVDQESTTTNIAANIRALTELLNALRPTP